MINKLINMVCPACGGTCDRLRNDKCIYCGTPFEGEVDLDELIEPLPPLPRDATAEIDELMKKTLVTAPEISIKFRQEEAHSPSKEEHGAHSCGCSGHLNSEDLFELNHRGVVEVITEDSRASGFMISSVGLVLTNAHAVSENGKICENIYIKQGQSRIKACVLAIGDTNVQNKDSADLALLAMEKEPPVVDVLRLGCSESVRIGQHVYYIGNSKGEGICMTAGIVSDKQRKVGERHYLMTDAATNPGNSGCPLFNECGEVIGVHVSARNEAVGMKYAIPIDTVRSFLNRVEEKMELPLDFLADDLCKKETHNESFMAGLATAATILGVAATGVSLIKDLRDILCDFWDRMSRKVTGR